MTPSQSSSSGSPSQHHHKTQKDVLDCWKSLLTSPSNKQSSEHITSPMRQSSNSVIILNPDDEKGSPRSENVSGPQNPKYFPGFYRDTDENAHRQEFKSSKLLNKGTPNRVKIIRVEDCENKTPMSDSLKTFVRKDISRLDKTSQKPSTHLEPETGEPPSKITKIKESNESETHVSVSQKQTHVKWDTEKLEDVSSPRTSSFIFPSTHDTTHKPKHGILKSKETQERPLTTLDETEKYVSSTNGKTSLHQRTRSDEVNTSQPHHYPMSPHRQNLMVKPSYHEEEIHSNPPATKPNKGTHQLNQYKGQSPYSHVQQGYKISPRPYTQPGNSGSSSQHTLQQGYHPAAQGQHIHQAYLSREGPRSNAQHGYYSSPHIQHENGYSQSPCMQQHLYDSPRPQMQHKYYSTSQIPSKQHVYNYDSSPHSQQDNYTSPSQHAQQNYNTIPSPHAQQNYYASPSPHTQEVFSDSTGSLAQQTYHSSIRSPHMQQENSSPGPYMQQGSFGGQNTHTHQDYSSQGQSPQVQQGFQSSSYPYTLLGYNYGPNQCIQQGTPSSATRGEKQIINSVSLGRQHHLQMNKMESNQRDYQISHQVPFQQYPSQQHYYNSPYPTNRRTSEQSITFNNGQQQNMLHNDHSRMLGTLITIPDNLESFDQIQYHIQPEIQHRKLKPENNKSDYSLSHLPNTQTIQQEVDGRTIQKKKKNSTPRKNKIASKKSKKRKRPLEPPTKQKVKSIELDFIGSPPVLLTPEYLMSIPATTSGKSVDSTKAIKGDHPSFRLNVLQRKGFKKYLLGRFVHNLTSNEDCIIKASDDSSKQNVQTIEPMNGVVNQADMSRSGDQDESEKMDVQETLSFDEEKVGERGLDSTESRTVNEYEGDHTNKYMTSFKGKSIAHIKPTRPKQILKNNTSVNLSKLFQEKSVVSDSMDKTPIVGVTIDQLRKDLELSSDDDEDTKINDNGQGQGAEVSLSQIRLDLELSDDGSEMSTRTKSKENLDVMEKEKRELRTNNNEAENDLQRNDQRSVSCEQNSSGDNRSVIHRSQLEIDLELSGESDDQSEASIQISNENNHKSNDNCLVFSENLLKSRLLHYTNITCINRMKQRSFNHIVETNSEGQFQSLGGNLTLVDKLLDEKESVYQDGEVGKVVNCVSGNTKEEVLDDIIQQIDSLIQIIDESL